MAGEMLLDKSEMMLYEGESELFENLEEKIGLLLTRYQELKKERDELVAALDREREKLTQMERRLEFLSQDREKVKERIDQLLHRLKGVDF